MAREWLVAVVSSAAHRSPALLTAKYNRSPLAMSIPTPLASLACVPGVVTRVLESRAESRKRSGSSASTTIRTIRSRAASGTFKPVAMYWFGWIWFRE